MHVPRAAELNGPGLGAVLRRDEHSVLCSFFMTSENNHGPNDLLSEESKNLHRAIVSLKEELEAIDWYQQRAEGCSDGDLRAVLVHNKNEEIEHAMMLLEWLRRHDPVFAADIHTYLNSSGSIAEGGHPKTSGLGAKTESADSNSLGVGSLKGVK